MNSDRELTETELGAVNGGLVVVAIIAVMIGSIAPSTTAPAPALGPSK
jgi:hypothetical protein